MHDAAEADDDTGWESTKYAGRAIIATAHAHAYSRTHLLDHMQTQSIASAAVLLAVGGDDVATPADEGASFAFVSGLGGKSRRAQEVSGAWFASIYQNAGCSGGALGLPIRRQPDPALLLQTITGQIVDSSHRRSCRRSLNRAVDAGALAALVPGGGARRRSSTGCRHRAVSLDVFDVRGRLVTCSGTRTHGR
jgi:hypothetical protein